ncbi:unnamed protein product [Diatraea saccharalis]|uniref:Regulatory protein zeste n=1 Tax=Diatraea saccharalis TaxID=40085 RepID=A0A9N9QSY8_9NEOP|nr:unnamed protein product [Diatraea saccharalis]
MAEKRKRSQNFTPEEKDKLVKLLIDYKNTILNNKTDGCTNEAKLAAWSQLTASFNATATIHRTKESLMKVWEKPKSDSKLYYSSTRRNISQTGGGPLKTDPILEQVCTIMGRGCSRLEGISDSDALTSVEIPICTEESLPKVLFINTGEDMEIDTATETEISPIPNVR